MQLVEKGRRPVMVLETAAATRARMRMLSLLTKQVAR